MGNQSASETKPKKELRADMENQKQTSFSFEIDNFLEKEAIISSPMFLSGGCKWFVKVYPKGNRIKDHLSLNLCVANPESLRPGWKRRANYSFIVLSQSGKELKRTSEVCSLFCAQFSTWGFPKMLPLSLLKGFLENNKLIVKVEVKVVEVAHESEVTGKEMLDYQGFRILYSQVVSVSWIFTEHPNIAVNFRPKNQSVKTTYMNVLLGLIETLNKPSKSLSETELSNAHNELTELTEAGFKLDWLKTKLEEVSLERKKADVADESKILELMESKLEAVFLERKKSDDAVVSRVQELHERVKNLEMMVSDLKVELEKEKAKSSAGGLLLVD